MLRSTQLVGFARAAAGALEDIEIIAEATPAAGGGSTTITFSSVSMGAGEADKVLVVTVNGINIVNVVSVTFDPAGSNIALTELIDVAGDNGGASAIYSGVIGNHSGTSKDIQVVTADDGDFLAIATATLRNVINATTATFTGSDVGGDSSANVANVTAEAGGIVFGAHSTNGEHTHTWNNLTEKVDALANGRAYTAAWLLYAGGRSASTETVTLSASAAHVLAIASLR